MSFSLWQKNKIQLTSPPLARWGQSGWWFPWWAQLCGRCQRNLWWEHFLDPSRTGRYGGPEWTHTDSLDTLWTGEKKRRHKLHIRNMQHCSKFVVSVRLERVFGNPSAGLLTEPLRQTDILTGWFSLRVESVQLWILWVFTQNDNMVKADPADT